MASPERSSAGGRALVVPLHVADDAGELDVAPGAADAILGRQVGQREAAHDVLKFDAIGVVALVGAGARALDRDGHARVALDRHPAELDVAEEHHARRAPVLERVGEHVDVHERAPRLPGAEVAQLAVGVAQAERGLPGVDAGAEELELERGLQLAHVGRDERLDSETALPRAERDASVLAVLVLERGELGGTQDVEPVRVDRLAVVAHVGHHVAVDLRLRLLLGGHRRGGQPRRQHDQRQRRCERDESVHESPPWQGWECFCAVFVLFQGANPVARRVRTPRRRGSGGCPSVGVHSLQDVRGDPAPIYSNAAPLQHHGDRSGES